MDRCEDPFWSDPKGFVTNFSLRYDPQCKNQILNFMARLLLLGTLVGAMGSVIGGGMVFVVCLFLATVIGFVIIMTTPSYRRKGKEQGRYVDDEGVIVDTATDIQLSSTFSAEGFKNNSKNKTKSKNNEGFMPMRRGITSGGIVGLEAALPYNGAAPYSGPALPDYTPPAARNLFMNVLIDEYKYNPDRPAAAPVTDPIVKQTFDDYFRVQWFSDPTDVFGKSQSQRQFVTQPSTSIPNDRESYQNWLYKIPGKTCKEGGQYCTDQGSAGVQYTWMGE